MNKQFATITSDLFGSDDTTKNQLDWLRAKSKHQTFLMDAAQSVRPADLLNVAAVALWATLGLWICQQFGALGAAGFSAVIGTLYAMAAAALLRSRRQIRSYLPLRRSV